MAKRKIKGFKNGVDGTVLKFKKAPPLTEDEIGSLLQWAIEDEAEQKVAQEWFEAFLQLDGQDFCDCLANNHPTPSAIWRLVGIAYAAEDPKWKEVRATQGAQSLTGAAKAYVLAEYAAYKGTPKDKGKSYFAQQMVKVKKVKNSKGKPISKFTIEKLWLPKG